MMKLKKSDILHINRCSGRKQSRDMIKDSCIKHTVVKNKKKYNRKNKHKLNTNG